MKFVVIALAIAAVIAGIVFGVWGYEVARCDAKTGGMTNVTHRWTLFGGCQVCENGSWIPLENYRFFGN